MASTATAPPTSVATLPRNFTARKATFDAALVTKMAPPLTPVLLTNSLFSMLALQPIDRAPPRVAVLLAVKTLLVTRRLHDRTTLPSLPVNSLLSITTLPPKLQSGIVRALERKCDPARSMFGAITALP